MIQNTADRLCLLLVDRLRVIGGPRHAAEDIAAEIDRLTAERDEARAVLKKVFDVTLYLPGAVTVTFDPVNPIVSMQARIDKARAEVAALKLKVKWFSLSPLSEEDVVGLKAIADSEGWRVRGTP